MKYLLLFALLSMPALATEEGWKLFAVISDPECSEDIKVLAKEGEKFVYAVNGAEKNKLLAEDASDFSAESMKSTVFSNQALKNSGKPSYSFTQPSYVEANPPKLIISEGGKQKYCRMLLR